MRDEIKSFLLSEQILKLSPRDDEPLRSCGMDSLGFLQLFDWMEGKYGVKVRDDEMNPETVGTIDRIVALIEGRNA